MVSNVRDRNIDSSRREDSRKGQVDRCEVINVRPHVQPYPADKDFNTVDVQLIDRPRISDKALTIEYVKLNSLQREHGRFQGHPWHARIGDMIYVYWLAEREALVLGTCTSVEQEPVCRSQADDQQQEYVEKLCPWEEPSKNADGNYIIFPEPKNPDCRKWWPKTLDSVVIYDCPLGNAMPSCGICDGLDNLIYGTCFKNFSYKSPTEHDKQNRFKFQHMSLAYWYFDADGTWRIQGSILEENGLDNTYLGHIHHDPYGSIDVHGDTYTEGTEDIIGNRMKVYGHADPTSDEHGEIAAELINLQKMALVRIYKDGSARVRASTDTTGNTAKAEIFLGIDGNCWLRNAIADSSCEIKSDGTIVLDGDVEVTGSLTHGGAACCNIAAAGWEDC